MNMGTLSVCSWQKGICESKENTKESSHHSYLQRNQMSFQEGQEGRSGELQASQPHISPCEGDEATNSGNHFQTHEGQEDDWKQSMWIYLVEVMLNQPASLLQ